MEEKVRAVALAAERAFVPHRETRRVETPTLRYVVTPSQKDSWLNRVQCFAPEPDATDVAIDAAIDAVLDEYRRADVPFKWIVGPDSSPANLGARLERRGLSRTDARGMACDPSALDVRAPSGVQVRVVGGEGPTVDDFAAALARGFGEPHDRLREHFAHVLASPRTTRLFLAFAAGVPVGAASFTELDESSAFLDAGAVVPEARGRGVYRALVAARLAALAERGITLAATHAREASSAPLLAHLGFETLFRFAAFAPA